MPIQPRRRPPGAPRRAAAPLLALARRLQLREQQMQDLQRVLSSQERTLAVLRSQPVPAARTPVARRAPEPPPPDAAPGLVYARP